MEHTYIEKTIKRNSRLIIGTGVFLSIGLVGVIISVASPLTTLLAVSSMIPVFTDLLGIGMLSSYSKNHIKNNIWFLDKVFKKLNRSSIQKYLNSSNSVTEKKYKIACLSLWEKYRNIEMNDFTTLNFSDINKELAKEKEVFPLYFLFGKNNTIDTDNTVKALLLEDSETNLTVAKKVYAEYINCAMAAKAFLYRENYAELLMLQDYKFTVVDYQYIKNFLTLDDTKKLKNNINLYSQEINIALEKIVENENSKDNLAILDQYVQSINKKGNMEDYLEIIRRKINYLDLDNKLEVKQEEKQAQKRKKI